APRSGCRSPRSSAIGRLWLTSCTPFPAGSSPPPTCALPELEERRGIWKRYLIGAAVLIVVAASATSVAGFNQLDRISAVIGHNPLDLGNDLAEAPPGKPQTILLIGSDKRAKTANDAKL